MGKNIIAIIVDLNTKTIKKGFNALDKRVLKSAKNFRLYGKTTKRVFTAIGVGVTALSAVILVGTKRAIKYAIEIDKMAKTTGLTRQAVTQLRYAMEQEHASFQTLSTSIPVLARRMMDANDGLETYAKMFRKARVAITDTDGQLREAQDVLIDLGGYMRSGASDTEKMAISQALLGRSGKELIPFLKLGSEEIEKLAKQAENLGLVLDTKDTVALKHLDDATVALTGGIRGLFLSIATKFAPAIEALTNYIIEKMPKIRTETVKWMNQFIQGSILVAEIVGPIFLWIFKTFKIGVENLISQAKFLHDNWDSIFSATVELIKSKFMDVISFTEAFFTWMIDNAQWSFEQLFEEIKFYLDLIADRNEVMITDIMNLAKWLGVNFVNSIKNMFGLVVQSFKNFGSFVSDWADFAASKMKFWEDTKLEPPKWEGLTKGFKSTWTKLEKTSFKSMEDIRKNAEKLFSDELPKSLMETYNAIRQELPDTGEKALDDLEKIFMKMPGKIGPSFEDIKENFTSIMETLRAAVAKTANIIVEELEESTEKSKMIFSSFKDFANQEMGVWAGVAISAVSAFTSHFGSAMADILLKTKSTKDAISGAWKGIKQAVVRAITDMIAKWLVWKAATAVFGLSFGGGFGGFLGSFAKGGQIPAFANGGPVPIMAHEGEYVIPKSMVDGIRKTGQVPGSLVEGIRRGSSPGGASGARGGVSTATPLSFRAGDTNISIASVSEKNIDAVIDRIGEEIDKRNAKAIDMASKAFNAGQKREGSSI